MPDIEITCAECGILSFYGREQEYYQERNLTHPKRCKPCRTAAVQTLAPQEEAAENVKGSRLPAINVASRTPFLSSLPSERPVLCGECPVAHLFARSVQAGGPPQRRPALPPIQETHKRRILSGSILRNRPKPDR